MSRLRLGVYILSGLIVALPVRGQSSTGQTSGQTAKSERHSPGPVREIGGGVGTVAAGPVKGAGSVAKGGAKAVGNAVTLHPIGAAESVVKGAAGAGKDVTVGTVKGTGKVAKGVGKVFTRIF